jgi:hypothetical protein
MIYAKRETGYKVGILNIFKDILDDITFRGILLSDDTLSASLFEVMGGLHIGFTSFISANDVVRDVYRLYFNVSTSNIVTSVRRDSIPPPSKIYNDRDFVTKCVMSVEDGDTILYSINHLYPRVVLSELFSTLLYVELLDRVLSKSSNHSIVSTVSINHLYIPNDERDLFVKLCNGRDKFRYLFVPEKEILELDNELIAPKCFDNYRHLTMHKLILDEFLSLCEE